MSTSKILFYIVLCLYGTSLLLPAFDGYQGYYVLLFGGFSLLDPKMIGFIAWTANILLFISLFVKLSPRSKLILGLMAAVFGFATFMYDSILVNEGGGREELQIAIGYYFWQMSLIVNTFLSYLNYKASKQQSLGINTA